MVARAESLLLTVPYNTKPQELYSGVTIKNIFTQQY